VSAGEGVVGVEAAGSNGLSGAAGVVSETAGVVSGIAGVVSGTAGIVSGTSGVVSGVVSGGSGIGSRKVLGRSEGELGVSAGVGCVARPFRGSAHGMRIEPAGIDPVAAGIDCHAPPCIVHELYTTGAE
jgi:hypothetical protein